MSDQPEVPAADDDVIKVKRDQYVQLVSDMWDDNQRLQDQIHQFERRCRALEQLTRGMGRAAELIELADLVAEASRKGTAQAAVVGNDALAKAFEIARRFIVENPKHGRKAPE